MAAPIVRNLVWDLSRSIACGARIRKVATSSFDAAPWGILRVDGKMPYAMCRPGAPKYISVPEDLFTNGASGSQHNIVAEDLHMNCQHLNGILPVAYTSTKSGLRQYIVFSKRVRVVKSLRTPSGEDHEFELHPKCQGARHYLALDDDSFYLIFQRTGDSGPSCFGARTSSLRDAADWVEFQVPQYLHAVDAIMFDCTSLQQCTPDIRAVAAKSTEVSDTSKLVEPRSDSLPRSAGPALAAFHLACGETRVSGYYRFIGWRNSKPEYRRIDGTCAAIYYNTSGEWVCFVENQILYRRVSSKQSPPFSDWLLDEGLGPAPRISPLGMQFVISNALQGRLLSTRLKNAAAELGLDLADIDRDSLVIKDVNGLPVVAEPVWTSLKYPILCTCFKKDAAVLETEISGASAGHERTDEKSKTSMSLATGDVEHFYNSSPTQLQVLTGPDFSPACTDSEDDNSESSADNMNARQVDKAPLLHECDGKGAHVIGVLHGGTITKYRCDDWLRPHQDDNRYATCGIVSKSNICEALVSLMARLKVRPAVGEAPHARVAMSPHTEWAIEALRQIREADTTLFERALGISTDRYDSDPQGILDMLIDIGPQLQARTQELNADPIEREFERIIGLSQVKEQIRKLRKSLRADMKRRKEGVQVPSTLPHHMIFVGNPGVGKTTMARLVAKILRDVGAVKGDRFVEVQREDLVAQFVGQTAPKTRRKISQAKGGVLFIDEAYRLTDSSEKDFGPEALEELMKDLETGDPLVIVAGYPDRMQRFLDTNPGLRRRFRNHYHFTDYTACQIADMFLMNVRRQGFFLDPEVSLETVSNLIIDHTTEAWRADHNGSVASRLFDNAKYHLDSRISLEKATKWELQTFSIEDIRQASNHLQG